MVANYERTGLQFKQLKILSELLKSAELEKTFVQGPDYWITSSSGMESNVLSFLTDNKIKLLCFGIDDNYLSHGLVGEIDIKLSQNKETLEASGYIETFQKNFKYGLALEVVRQDFLQRMANELSITIVQEVVDINQYRVNLTPGMREAWLKLYSEDGYFGFDAEGKKTFVPLSGSGIKDVGSIHLSVKKNDSQTISPTLDNQKTIVENPRAQGEELIILLKKLLDPKSLSKKTNVPF